jgi:hypothetical protein
MAFLNDAKQLAEQASRSIEQGLDQVRERIDDLQRQRRFNELARELGLLVYRSRLRGGPLDDAEVQRITAEMAAIETMPTAPPGPSGPSGPSGAAGPGGDAGGPTGQEGPTGQAGPTGPTGQTGQGGPPSERRDGRDQGGGYSLDDV